MFNRSKQTLDNKNRSHLNNLMSIAMADGQLAEQEYQVLYMVAKRLGMSEVDITDIRLNPESVKFTAPKSYDEKVQQIEDFICLMSADNDIDPNEIEVCKKLAMHLDLAPRIIDDLLSGSFEGRPRQGAA